MPINFWWKSIIGWYCGYAFYRIFGRLKAQLLLNETIQNFICKILIRNNIDLTCVCIVCQVGAAVFFFYNFCDCQILTSLHGITQKLVYEMLI